jgi:hypothetical protein
MDCNENDEESLKNSYSSEDDDDNDNYEDDEDEELDDAFANYLRAACVGNVIAPSMKSPLEVWEDYISSLLDSKGVGIGSTAFKVTDEDCNSKYGINDTDTANKILPFLEGTSGGVTHVILGSNYLSLVDHVRLFRALAMRHATTLTYLKLSIERCNVKIMLGLLIKATNLKELELHNLTLCSQERQVDIFAAILQRSVLRQLNLLQIQVLGNLPSCPSSSCLDAILLAAANIETLDELRLKGASTKAITTTTTTNTTKISTMTLEKSSTMGGVQDTPMISCQALQNLLVRKKKWWRLGLDSLGLTDDHCHVLANCFASVTTNTNDGDNDANTAHKLTTASTPSSDSTIKVGDLLSLRSNPAMTQLGYKALFTVLYQKSRMGLVQVDDAFWVAEFDLVRSLNNLHGRLNVVSSEGTIRNRQDWIEWLARIGNGVGSWESDSKKLNYLWFAIRHNPEMLLS